MSRKKNLLSIACFVAASVGAAVPAMALENEFHGLFKQNAYYSNYQDGQSGFALPASRSSDRVFMEQRGQIMYVAKVNDNYKMVTHFEIDSRWGDNSYNTNTTYVPVAGLNVGAPAAGSPAGTVGTIPASQLPITSGWSGRNNGGAVGADQVNIETKNVYLDANLTFMPVKTNLRLGIQGFYDPYKGILFSNDGAGAVITNNFSNVTTKVAFFRFYDDLTSSLAPQNGQIGTQPTSTLPSGVALGHAVQDFIMLDGKLAVSKDLNVGASYFLLKDSRTNAANPLVPSSEVHMVGLNAAATFGPASVDAFGLYQFGRAGNLNFNVAATGAGQVNQNGGTGPLADPVKDLRAFAFGAAARVKVANIGTARLLGLYVSGDSDPTNGSKRTDFQTIRSTEQSLYSANMMILLRSKDAINSDRALVHNFNNANQGVIGGFGGWDMEFGKAYWYSNVGILAAARTARDNYMATEVNTEIGYKILDNLKASFQAAYAKLGDFYNGLGRTPAGAAGLNPDDPYEFRTVITYVF